MDVLKALKAKAKEQRSAKQQDQRRWDSGPVKQDKRSRNAVAGAASAEAIAEAWNKGVALAF